MTEDVLEKVEYLKKFMDESSPLIQQFNDLLAKHNFSNPDKNIVLKIVENKLMVFVNQDGLIA